MLILAIKRKLHCATYSTFTPQFLCWKYFDECFMDKNLLQIYLTKFNILIKRTQWSHYMKEYLWRIYEEFHKTSYTSVILHLFFCVYRRRICEEFVYATVYCLKFYIILNKFKSVQALRYQGGERAIAPATFSPSNFFLHRILKEEK